MDHTDTPTIRRFLNQTRSAEPIRHIHAESTALKHDDSRNKTTALACSWPAISVQRRARMIKTPSNTASSLDRTHR
jgi:hypothetical protein